MRQFQKLSLLAARCLQQHQHRCGLHAVGAASHFADHLAEAARRTSCLALLNRPDASWTPAASFATWSEDGPDLDDLIVEDSVRRRPTGGRKSQATWEAAQLSKRSAGGARGGKPPTRSSRGAAAARGESEEEEEIRVQLAKLGFGPASDDEEAAALLLDDQNDSAPLPEGDEENLKADIEAEAAELGQGEIPEALAGDGGDGSDDDGDGDSDEEDDNLGAETSIGEAEIDRLEAEMGDLPQDSELGAASSDLAEIMNASKKRQRFLLQQKLKSKQGHEQLDLRPPDTGDFRMKIVDVNRTSKGARAGRVQGVSALVVVGNNDGILGQGAGKAAEAKQAVDKATRRALKNLTYVPRFRGHTIHYPTTVLFGKSKLIMYPRASNRGIKASDLLRSVCVLAGLKDLGIKIQGSRNVRNVVKCLFKAFAQMHARVDEDTIDAAPSPDWPDKSYIRWQQSKLKRLLKEAELMEAETRAEQKLMDQWMAQRAARVGMAAAEDDQGAPPQEA